MRKRYSKGVVFCWVSSIKILESTDDGFAAPELHALPCGSVIPFMSNCNPIKGFCEGKETLKTV